MDFYDWCELMWLVAVAAVLSLALASDLFGVVYYLKDSVP